MSRGTTKDSKKGGFSADAAAMKAGERELGTMRSGLTKRYLCGLFYYSCTRHMPHVVSVDESTSRRRVAPWLLHGFGQLRKGQQSILCN